MLRVGYIPEHFSTPIMFALKKKFINVELIEYPSGSGHLIQSLNDGSIDVGIGLTEAFVRGIANGDGYKMIGTYVQSPLRWSITTGINRDVTSDLEGKRISVSRIGSGSYVMAFVLALREGYKKPFYSEFPVVSTFKNLRDSVNLKGVDSEGKELKDSDAFMWEYFTTKKYYDSGEVKQIGEIYTPWPSWCVNSREGIEGSSEVLEFMKGLKKGIDYFNENKEEAIEHIYTNLDYSEADAREWIKTVEFGDLSKVEDAVIEKTYKVLIEAGVLEESEEVIKGRLDKGVVSINI